MRSVVELEIEGPRDRIAELYADASNNSKWMDDLVRNEPIFGQPGDVGSQYRMVSRDSDMHFVVTVVSVRPDNVRLHLDERRATVDVNVDFVPLNASVTRFVSTEEFHFKRLVPRLAGLFARRAIRTAHQRHMEAFKRFAESEHRQGATR
jgi:polyketide cyclase/dehydrase/lipid transport protein